jgi:formylglycine-generating enzyme required for sulfatase activity
MHLWSEIIGLIKADEKLFSLVHDRLQKLVSFRLAEGGPAIGSLESLSRTLAPLNALERITKNISISQYWHDDFGEPEWVTIPAGNFWMGSENAWGGKPLHELYISEFQIACVPVTNAQYAIYVKDTGALPPKHWPRDKIHVGLESHPVVGVSWYDALAYCKWLGEKTHKIITLPSEAEWEKAARGNEDKREYPWGADYSWQSDLRCNSKELGLNKPQGTTTPVGLFLNGRSPYCVLDMSGNVWEWTRSVRSLQKEGEEIKKEKTFSQRVKLAVANAVPTLPNWLASSLSGEISNAVETKILKEYNYPYDAGDGREDINANSNSPRSLRGGSFSDNSDYARCVYRDKWYSPDYRRNDIGFRVVVTSLIQEHTE